jgi:hypothetical protein
MPTPDQDLAAACREWIKGCTCAARDTPQECEECTDGFLRAVLDRARRHGLEIGENSLEDLPEDDDDDDHPSLTAAERNPNLK